jgi:hypothetical protein
VGSVKLGVIVGDLYAGDHQVILLIWRVSSQYQSVDRIVLSIRPAQRDTLNTVLVCVSGMAHYSLECTTFDKRPIVKSSALLCQKTPHGKITCFSRLN